MTANVVTIISWLTSQMRAILTTGMWLQPRLAFNIAFVLADVSPISMRLNSRSKRHVQNDAFFCRFVNSVFNIPSTVFLRDFYMDFQPQAPSNSEATARKILKNL
uniref:Uncharacterized protein n=1 Tax=Tanacetum cinerariifolium TaxID=118510 RepID=A0A6L2LYE3_TANCI|nr:hypothetical protein [Tanacetum cinerariifolium]